MTISRPQILLTGYTNPMTPRTGYTNFREAEPCCGLKPDWTTPANPPMGLIWAQPNAWNATLPYPGNEHEGFILPQSYFNKNRFYDTMRFTVTLDPPIANPVMNMAMFGWAVGWGDNVWISKPFGKLSIVGATSQNGNSIPVTMSRAAGWDYGGFRFIFRNGLSMEDGTPSADTNAHFIKGNNYSGGTTAFDSGGQLVSSITFVSANSWANRGGLTTAYAENWGFQLNVPESVSALSRLVPGSQYGDATHVITTTGVRLGASVAEGNKTRYMTTANSGTWADNSDSGMDALRGRTLPAASAGQPYTIDNIPVSNTSNRTLGLQGWIDFNGNGRFDAGEGSQITSVVPGQTFASLTFNTPATVASNGKQALRLRLGPVDQINGQPSGLAAMGEVEDYAAFVPTQSAPDLQVVKTTQTASVEPGGQIVYYLDVRNNSASTVNDIMVSDQIPTQIASFTATGTQGSQYDGSRNFQWYVGSLAPGGTARVTITGQVSAAVAVGSTITNTGTVTSPQGCLNARSCSSTVTDTVKTPVISDLSIVKTNNLGGSNPLVSPGDTYSYSIAVTNNSTKPYTNVVVQDQLPDGLSYVSGTGWTFTGQRGQTTIASLAPGERVVLTLTVRVNADATGKLRNVSVIQAMNSVDTCATTPTAQGCGVDNNPPTVLETPLSIYKTNDLHDNSVVAGTEFTYTITVTNPGGRTANEVRVTDILPKELEFSSTTQDGWASISGRAAVSTTFNLAPGAQKVLYLKVRALEATTEMITNMVMAEQLAPSTAAKRVSAEQAEAKIEACVEGETSGACAADDSPFEITPKPQPTTPVDPWGTGSGSGSGSGSNATPAPQLNGSITSYPTAVRSGDTFVSNLFITNSNPDYKVLTVRAYAPNNATFQPGYQNFAGWSFSGRSASTSNIVVRGGGGMMLLPIQVKVSGSGQSYPVVFTVDGSDPAQCKASSPNCFWDQQPPRS